MSKVAARSWPASRSGPAVACDTVSVTNHHTQSMEYNQVDDRNENSQTATSNHVRGETR